ncbi:hypothetical protein CMI37_33205 [Candidatus Pacearchaeota archaeon]|nr:hypothetical protein [Candidatus Pacearchaeota archaeon]|tara:strand:- start:2230 stop:2493 length:264 start_codon:yes stop_codon:yes gene_type:complete
MVQLLRKAPRDVDGRVRGTPPPRLVPKVVRLLSLQEQVELGDITEQLKRVMKRRMAFLAQLGLNPHKAYRFNRKGEVIEIGRHDAIY